MALHHKTIYRYDRLVSLAPHIIRLRPAPHSRTPILSYSLSVQPAQHFLNWQQDPQGNYLARVVFLEQTRCLEILVDLVADLVVINPFDFFLEPSAETYPFAYEPGLAGNWPVSGNRAGWPETPGVSGGCRSPARENSGVSGAAQPASATGSPVHHRMEPGIQSCEETLAIQRGSCRDSAWLLVQILRHLGLAARFVSGYLIQLVPDVKPLDGPSGPAQDFTDLHAWAEVYLPGAGWVGLDPTSGLFAGKATFRWRARQTPLAPHYREGGPVCGGFSLHHVGRPAARRSAGHQTLYRSTVAGDRCPRAAHRCRAGSERCAVDHGGRTDVCVDR